MNYSEYKILISLKKLSGLKSFFSARGFNVIENSDEKDLLQQTLEEQPHVLLMNLINKEFDACAFCKKLFKVSPNIRTKVLIISGLREKKNIISAIESGASDYILIPFENDNLLDRVKYHLRKIRVIEHKQLSDVLHDERVGVIFGVLEVLSQGLPPHETLYNIVIKTENIILVERCNVIAVGQFTDTGYVAAANDDPNFSGFKLDLVKYPEVQQVLNSGKIVVIEDIANDPVMKSIKKELKSISFNSILVAPVIFKGATIGVLSIRAKESKKTFSDDEIKICQLLAIASAPVLYKWRLANKDLIDKGG